MERETTNKVHETADVVVIGGGPAGSAAALRLARHRLHVIQLERRIFASAHNDTLRSGEGLIPRTRRELDLLGIDTTTAPYLLTQIDRVRTRWLDGTRTEDHIRTRGGIQMIDRGRFDHHLFTVAQRAGVDGRQGWRVHAFHRDRRGRIAGVLAQAPDGRLHEIGAPIVVDAGGHNALSLRELDLRIAAPDGDFFAMALYFDHMADVRPGLWEMHLFDPDDMTIVQITQLGPQLVRCGLGTTMRSKQARERGPEAYFWARLQHAPGLLRRLQNSQMVQRPWVRGAIGYRVRDVVFDGLLLIGDAAGYVNPLFGDGIYRALRSAKHAATTVAAACRHGDCSRTRLAAYARRHAAAACINWCEQQLVRGMYRHNRILNNMGQINLIRQTLFNGLLSS